jgi:carbon storage regulator
MGVSASAPTRLPILAQAVGDATPPRVGSICSTNPSIPHGKDVDRLRIGRGSKKEPTMLVLSRHRDESIMIGDEIVVTIVDIRGDKVRLGIDAPQDIPVHRQEVYEAIQRENHKASQIQPSETRDVGK